MCGVGLCVGLCVVCRGDVCVSSCLAPKTLPCTFKTLQCERSKRSRVYFHNARVSVFNVHTGAFSTYTRERLSLLFSRLSSSRVSLFLSLLSQ